MCNYTPHKSGTLKRGHSILSVPFQVAGKLLLFLELLTPKAKAKPSGLPDSNFIFFVATKKTKQKKTRRGAGICVCMVSVLLTRITTSVSDVSPSKETKGALPSGPPR